MTHQEVLRAGGMYPLRNGHFVWSEEAFKAAFKPGDIICGYGSRVTGKITAIGEKRFLYIVTRGSQVSERVGTIRTFTGWGKP